MLEQYRQRRHFGKTSEPPPEAAAPTPQVRPLTFTIQEHAARRLHYDLRLEMDGVMRSWPIPKGPSYDPHQKRLAVMTEDHPLAYGTFEGIIPAGEYGAGEVIVWDAGTYTPVVDDELPDFQDRDRAEKRAREGVARGKLKVFMNGHKLKGVWTLIKTHGGDGRSWLWVKHHDATSDATRDVIRDQRSVLSGCTIQELKSGALPRPRVGPATLLPTAAPYAGAHEAVFPERLGLMLPSPSQQAFSHPDWLFEPKLDGYRVLVLLRDGVARLVSRSGRDIGGDYPDVAEQLRRQPVQSAVIDGEIVALDDRGTPSFQAMQNRASEEQLRLHFYAFDLLYLDGWDVRRAPLTARKELLQAVFAPIGDLSVVEQFDDGEALFRIASEHGLEGVVAKRRASLYESGQRTTSWLKIKTSNTDDFVIGGFTSGAGNRADDFGSLLVGSPDGTGRLTYAGHVGTGFDQAMLADLTKRLQRLRTEGSPFADDVPSRSRWSRGASRGVRWVRPNLVAEVKFSDRTRDGILRHPVFLRLRPDKASKDAQQVPVVSAPRSALAPHPAPPIEDLVAEALGQLEGSGDKLSLRIGDARLPLTNLDKILWPAAGRRMPAFSKRDLVRYYLRIAPAALPHLRDRPLTMVRYPNGIAAGKFYQKDSGRAPEFVQTVKVYAEHAAHDVEYVLCNNVPTLVWLAQIADLELHPTPASVAAEPDAHSLPNMYDGSADTIQASRLNYPDFLVVDLDPYLYSGKEAQGAEPELHREGFKRTREVAHRFRELFDDLKLPCFVKTTGKTGLHVYVPILRTITYPDVHLAAEALARLIERSHGPLVTLNWPVADRTGRVFLDYNMNVRGKTLASAYSPRAVPWAGVSMPVTWHELDRIYPTDFTIATAPDRVQRDGDAWAHILESKVDLSSLVAHAGGGDTNPRSNRSARHSPRRRTGSASSAA